MNPQSRLERLIAFSIAPFFIFLRKVLLELGLLRHKIRQRYLLGTLKEGRTVKDFHSFLYKNGFRMTFYEWIDKDQELGVRKLVDNTHQYHLRVFKDGEVRGHYEKTPERHPIDHMYQRGMEPYREEFLNMIGDWITETPVPKEHLPHHAESHSKDNGEDR